MFSFLRFPLLSFVSLFPLHALPLHGADTVLLCLNFQLNEALALILTLALFCNFLFDLRVPLSLYRLPPSAFLGMEGLPLCDTHS